jgi:CheY-like chemotaxis protein
MDHETAIPDELQDRIRILVVEDNPLNQKLDSFLLQNWGLKHFICANGVEAISALKFHKWDLVLMDIRLPEIDGYQTTRIIREEMNLDVPIIGITAYAAPGEKERCLAAGMSNYITKPVNEEELLSMLLFYLVPVQAEAVAVKS